MSGAGRGLEDDKGGRGHDLANPFGEQGAKAGFGRRGRGEIVGQRVAGLAAAADLDRAQLVEVAADGRLSNVKSKVTQGSGKLVLAGQAAAAEQVGKGSLAFKAGVSHARFMHELA